MKSIELISLAIAILFAILAGWFHMIFIAGSWTFVLIAMVVHFSRTGQLGRSKQKLTTNSHSEHETGE